MHIINIKDSNYPELLRKIKKPPQILYVEGNVNLLNQNLFAIIGSRNYSEYGEIQSRKFAKELCKKGLVIVSGMAIGIDTFAHIETIKNGGKTIAVLGCGFENIYPKENKKLYELIIQSGGAVLSEYAPSIKMQKKNFPHRNRIVSGISIGTLVVEATYRSGTTITANNTWEQGKKVFCIPNCIDNKNSSGIITLLKKGAILVTKPEEILKNFAYENNGNDLNTINCRKEKMSENNSKIISEINSEKDSKINSEKDSKINSEKNSEKNSKINSEKDSKINLEKDSRINSEKNSELNLEKSLEKNSENVVYKKEISKLENEIYNNIEYLNIANLVEQIESKLIKQPQKKICGVKEKKSELESKNKKEQKDRTVKLNQYDENTIKVITTIKKNQEIDSSNISEILDLQVHRVNSILTNLEIEDIIEMTTGCRYKIINNIIFIS